MNKPNIVFTRIDNRLIHGQVGVIWTKSVDANLILLVDDEVAEDKMQQSVMSLTAKSSGIDIRFFSINETVDKIYKASESQKLFIVCRSPETVLRLLQNGIPLKEINIGNIHDAAGKEKITKRVYLNDAEKEQLYKISKFDGVDLFIQDVPSDKRIKYPL